MKKYTALSLLFVTLLSSGAFAAASISDKPENVYERSIEAVVRHKEFYKAGKIETGFVAGVMPYDSVINHYMLGGRLAWHFADHYAWEIADVQLVFPSVSSFTNDLITSKGISNLQTNKLHFLVATNFMLSPLYGKVRIWGANVIHFDTYIVAGLGFAKDDTARYGTNAMGGAPQEIILRSGIDPMFDFGLGFKLFLNDAMALNLDIRDYVLFAQTYNQTQLKSNFSVYLGISFFIPTFG